MHILLKSKKIIQRGNPCPHNAQMHQQVGDVAVLCHNVYELLKHKNSFSEDER